MLEASGEIFWEILEDVLTLRGQSILKTKKAVYDTNLNEYDATGIVGLFETLGGWILDSSWPLGF